MARFIIRKLLLIPLSLIVIVTLAYAYAHTVQWDYASRYSQLAMTLRRENRPKSFFVAYRAYVEGLTQGDLGSLRNGESIATVLRQASAASLGLLAVALTLSVPIGLALGIAAAHWESLRPSRWLTIFTTAGLAMPSFYVGSLLILISVAYALWRGGGAGLPFPLAGFGWDKHMVFPVTALMIRPTVQIAQVTGSLLTGELQKPYVFAARSLGHARVAVKRRLALRNVLASVVLTIATSLRTLVTDLILVEWLFFWPGLGRFLAAALIPASRTDIPSSPYLLDPELTAALLGAITLIFLTADFIASIFIRIFDPRLRVPAKEEVADV